MKLELKHLACYLPYGLKIWDKDEEPIQFTMVAEDQKDDYLLYTINIIIESNDVVKPILRPLSDLTKDFVMENNLSDVMPCEYYLGFNIEIDELNQVGFRTPESWLPLVNWLPFYQKLFELHLDVFGLIEKGLAIDINTL